eukprot:TRINITY_DN2413_c0_g1_i5.p1 TRINITY_DN2413_c0_g1~~TRINITY_DN2413_c0_g1_i5.p1  ORF type:complete len:362 (-),score=83.48 TRINITY_DN2413_c0_g1_i5:147-1232(-)
MSNTRPVVTKEVEMDTSKLPSAIGGFKFTFGSRSSELPLESKRLRQFRRLAKSNEPQPGLYCFSSTIGKSPGVRLDPPRTRVFVNKTFSLGPGSYSPMETANVPTHLMRRPKEHLRAATTAPGPGNYFQDTYMDNLMNYMHPPLAKSMGRVFQSAKRSASKDTPGPGSYSLDVKRKIPGPKIISKTTTHLRPVERERQMNLKSEKPIEPKKLVETFGKALRSELAAKTVGPGPDAYQRIDTGYQQSRNSTAMNKESCTFGIKTMKFFQTNKNPGPNAYFYNTTSNGFSYSIGKALRKGYQAPTYNEKYYDVKDLYSGPRVAIGSEKREYAVGKSKYPGPGTYNIPGSVGVIPSYLLNSQGL